MTGCFLCRLLPFLFAGLLAACGTIQSTVGLDSRLDPGSQTRFAERWRSIKMGEADIAAMSGAIDPDADPGKVPVRLGAGGAGTATLSVAGWQGCRSIDQTAAFTDTIGHPVNAHLFGLICPPQPISVLGHWHLARLQILAPLPPPPPPPAVHKDDKGGLGTIFAKPAAPATPKPPVP